MPLLTSSADCLRRLLHKGRDALRDRSPSLISTHRYRNEYMQQKNFTRRARHPSMDIRLARCPHRRPASHMGKPTGRPCRFQVAVTYALFLIRVESRKQASLDPGLGRHSVRVELVTRQARGPASKIKLRGSERMRELCEVAGKTAPAAYIGRCGMKAALRGWRWRTWLCPFREVLSPDRVLSRALDLLVFVLERVQQFNLLVSSVSGFSFE